MNDDRGRASTAHAGQLVECRDVLQLIVVLRPGWPSMVLRSRWSFVLEQPVRVRREIPEGWYITGARASIDSDGYYWFVGRVDDVINMVGHCRRCPEVRRSTDISLY